MKRLSLAIAFCLLGTLPAFAALETGDQAPKFAALASMAGKSFHYSLANALKKGPVVVYFFPSAYTRGCDLEAHTFAENIDKFTRAGASIIGVSLDNIQRLNDFSKDPNYCAGKFPTASDSSGTIAKSFGVAVQQGPPGLKDVRGIAIDHGFAARTTFVVSPNGHIAASIGGASPTENVTRALAAVDKLATKP